METIPLFPLGTVLFPGLLLPLRIFEPRYRLLMERLLALPDGTPREFGVVAIRQGWEVGTDGVSALYPIGCTARLRRVAQLDDGTYEIVTVGADRFRVEDVDSTGQPYLQAQVQRLPDVVGAAAEARLLARSVLTLYRDYLAAVAATRHVEVAEPDRLDELLQGMPDDPLVIASLVASTAQLELGDQQSLLAAPDAVSRLRAELRLLKREATMLGRLGAVPVALAQLRVPSGLN